MNPKSNDPDEIIRQKLSKGFAPPNPMQEYERKLTACREGVSDPMPAMGKMPADLDGDGDDDGGTGEPADDLDPHVAAIGDLVRNIAVSDATIAEKKSKIGKALALLDDDVPAEPKADALPSDQADDKSDK